MEKLLELYKNLIQSAEDHQITQHLQNFLEDAAKVTAAVEAVLEEVRQQRNG